MKKRPIFMPRTGNFPGPLFQQWGGGKLIKGMGNWVGVGKPGNGPPSPGDLLPIYWFDAANSDTLFQDTGGATPVTSDGQVVARWEDLSTNGYVATQATVSAQPVYKTGIINTLPVVRCNQDWLSFPASLLNNPAGDAHIFIVASTGLSGRTVLSTRPPDPGNGWGIRMQTTADLYFHSGYTPNVSGTASVLNVPKIIEVRRDNLSVEFGANGLLNAPVAMTNLGDLNCTQTTIGAEKNGTTLPFVGDIGEIVAYDALLSASARSGLLAYFSEKWGITLI